MHGKVSYLRISPRPEKLPQNGWYRRAAHKSGHSALARTIEGHVPQCADVPLKKGTPISSRNFRNRVLLPIQQKLNQEFRKQGKPELNAPLSFQVLRRSQATRNQRRLKDVQAHLGHRSIVTTANIYAQEIPASVKEIVATDESEVLTASKTVESIGPKLAPKKVPRKTVSA